MQETHKNFLISDISDGMVTDFDLWLNIDGLEVLYAGAPYVWGGGEAKRLLDDGYKTLLFAISDQQKVDAYLKLKAIDTSLRDVSPKKQVVSLTEMAAAIQRVFYEQGFSETLLGKVDQVAGNMVHVIMEEPTCVTALGLLGRHDDYTYFHSARVAAYGIAIALAMAEKDVKRLREIALGCLLHDIGKSKVPLDVIHKPGALTDAEWQVMKKHPQFGEEIIKGASLSHVIHGIVVHHHERMDGKGYPHGLARLELPMEVRIAMFADTFDALTTNRSYQRARSRFEALELIRHNLLTGLDKDVYKAMVSLLGLPRAKEGSSHGES